MKTKQKEKDYKCPPQLDHYNITKFTMLSESGPMVDKGKRKKHYDWTHTTTKD